MFEQSILAGDRKNRPWSFLASVSAELVVVSLFILIPLAYTDHLPDFHWRNVMVGPPLRPIDPPTAGSHTGNSSMRFVSTRTIRIFNPTQPSRDSESSTTGPVQLDVPPGSLPSDTVAGTGNPMGELLARAPVARTPPRPVVNDPPAHPTAQIRVSQGAQMALLIKQVIPTYPPLARATRTSGVVHLVGVISKDGTIRNLQLISGHPLLTRAALDAVAQWVYRPTLLNGEPVEVICPIDVHFTLSQ